MYINYSLFLLGGTPDYPESVEVHVANVSYPINHEHDHSDKTGTYEKLAIKKYKNRPVWKHTRKELFLLYSGILKFKSTPHFYLENFKELSGLLEMFYLMLNVTVERRTKPYPLHYKNWVTTTESMCVWKKMVMMKQQQ